MTKGKKKHIAEEVSAISLKYQGNINSILQDVSNKRIRLGCDYIDMSDKEIMNSLHGIKLDFVKMGNLAYQVVEAIKKYIDSNPDEPDLPLTNEDLQDDNPVEGIDY